MCNVSDTALFGVTVGIPHGSDTHDDLLASKPIEMHTSVSFALRFNA